MWLSQYPNNQHLRHFLPYYSTSIQDSDLSRNVDESLIDEEAHIPVQQLCHILKNLPEDDNINEEVLCVSQVGN